MKCESCEATAAQLMQVVAPKSEDQDTSAFAYKLVCQACVDKKGLADKVVQTVSQAS